MAGREGSHIGYERKQAGVEEAMRRAIEDTHIPMVACEAVSTFRGPALSQEHGTNGGMLYLWNA
jgi:hypothetical protein